MKRAFGLAGLLAALLLGLPVVAADKKNNPPAKDASDQDYKALADAHTVTGKLASVGGSDKSINLRVEYPVLEANPNAKGVTGNALNVLRLQEEIMRTQNPILRAQRLQRLEVELARMQTKELNAVKVTRDHKDFDLQSTAGVKVRYLEPPVVYDDKGFQKKFTADELKEMKGNDPNVPGYAADFDKLAPGQTVRVTVVRPKADKAKDKDAADDHKPQASMIVIVAEAPASAAPAKGKKNK
jgi:hypothetical protein